MSSKFPGSSCVPVEIPLTLVLSSLPGCVPASGWMSQISSWRSGGKVLHEARFFSSCLMLLQSGV